MNTYQGAFAQKLRPLHAESWTAWRLGERQSYPIELDAPASLDDALTQAVAHCSDRGETLAILYSHAGLRKNTLWLYAVKRSTKKGTWRAAYDGGRKVFVGKLEPKLICETAMASFAPVEAFDALRDNPTGVDPALIDLPSAPRQGEGE